MLATIRRYLPRGARRHVVTLSIALTLCLSLAACGATPTRPSAAHSAGVAAPGRTLVVMGASDAYGVGAYDPDRQNWPTQLAGDLPQPIHLVNLGIPGATLAQARQEELPIALAQRPQILVVWLAVNDIIADVPLSTYSADLRSTLAALKAESPGTRVFVGNVPDLSRLPYFDMRDPATLRAQVSQWNVAIAQVCAAEGATVVDLASTWGRLGDHADYISSDGLHPSTLGAAELAAYFNAIIRQTLDLNR